jgi:histidinol-phosphate phosphatase family protein
MKPAVFMDRDGVLVENVPDYIRRWEQVEFFDHAFRAVMRLHESPFEMVVVSNQSVVGRGLMALEDVLVLNRRIMEVFESQGALFAGTYICPHAPEDDCECRKPKPGMLLRAAREHDLDLSRSFFVGDAQTDMEAAEAAGVKGILVRTGRGTETLNEIGPNPPWPVAGDLDEAVSLILGNKA